jgi:hypothetical protein
VTDETEYGVFFVDRNEPPLLHIRGTYVALNEPEGFISILSENEELRFVAPVAHVKFILNMVVPDVVPT